MNKYKLSIILLTCMLMACRSPKEKPAKMLVINIRGTSFQMVENYAKAQPSGLFGRLISKDEIKEVMPVHNAVTATNLAAFETGKLPAVHGILGHQFGHRKDGKLDIVSGFSRPYATPSFLELADEAGKKVMNIGALTLHGSSTTHRNLEAVAQGNALSEPQLIKLDNPFSRIELLDGQFLEVQRPEGEENVGYSLHANNRNCGDLRVGQWREVPLNDVDSLKCTTWVKLIKDADSTDQLFIRAAFVNRGYPKATVKAIESAHGGAKGWPSLGLYFTGLIDEVTVKEEIDREVDYVMNLCLDRLVQNYDLVVMDYPRIDRYGHIFSLDTAQKSTLEAFEHMEKDLERLLLQAERNGYRVLVQSGHGFSKLHTEIDLNKALDSLSARFTTEIVGVPGKVAAHLYFPEASDKKILASIADKLIQWKDPKTGAAITEKVWHRSALGQLGMNHSNAGDLFVLLKPGYVFSAISDSDGPLYKPATFKGDHGYAPSYPESRGVLMHPGYNIHGKSLYITEVAKIVIDYLEL